MEGQRNRRRQKKQERLERERSAPKNWNTLDTADPSPKGPLGADDEMPDGGDSTRFPEWIRQRLEEIRNQGKKIA